MKRYLLAILMAQLILPCFASDTLVGAPARSLFYSSFNLGGDSYCKPTKCSLIAHCVFDRLGEPDDAKYECEINQKIQLNEQDSEDLFRNILDATRTMDGKCSANFCELTADCSYSHFFFRKYKCEIF